MEGQLRTIIIAVAVLAAACGGQLPDSPTSPAATSLGLTQQPPQGGTGLPLKGSYTSTSASTFSPPITLIINGTGEGTSTVLGRFTAAYTHMVNVTNTMATGTMTLTAANGDQLQAELAGHEDEFIPPNVSLTTVVATVVGGTGRFISATGNFTIRSRGVIDFGAETASESATFQGTINLNR